MLNYSPDAQLTLTSTQTTLAHTIHFRRGRTSRFSSVCMSDCPLMPVSHRAYGLYGQVTVETAG